MVMLVDLIDTNVLWQVEVQEVTLDVKYMIRIF